ncbi:MAG: Ig-like domain-containing protein [Myxococcales bacterium]|nr:Ig-like domain-containing protein [Myxococcales bacterium]
MQKLTWIIFLTIAGLAGCAGEDTAATGPAIAVSDAAATSDGIVSDTASDTHSVSDSGSRTQPDTQQDTLIQFDTGADAGNPGLPEKVVAITLHPAAATLAVGSQVALAATAKLDDGTSADATALVQWATSGASVVQINASGVAVGIAAGAATVTASLDGVVGSAQLTVSPLAITKLALTPTKASIGIGATQKFSVIATMEGGSTEDVSASAVWSVDDAKVASAGVIGAFVGLQAGQTTVRAKVGAAEATAQLTVTGAAVKGLSLTPADAKISVGGSVKMTVTAIYDDGTAADVSASATWSSSAPSSAKVDGSGLVAGVGPGVAIISASFEGQLASRPVTVLPKTVKLTKITVSPAKSTLAAGTSVTLKATGLFDDGSNQDLTTSAIWSVSDNKLATVSNDPLSAGQVTAIAAGSLTVSATFGGVTGEALVAISAATLTKLAIKPTAVTVPLGLTSQLQALGTYSDGKVLDVTTKATWTSSPAGVATVSNGAQGGLVTGSKTGSAQVTANIGQIQATAKITVLASVLTKIEISPTGAAVPVGNKQAFTAKGTWSGGNSQDVTQSVVWTVSDEKLASISNAKGTQGSLTALAPGQVTITATIGNISGKVSVKLSAPTLTKLTIGPANATRKAGQSVQFWVVAELSNGKTANVTQQAKWSTSNPAVATINTGNFNVAVVQAKSAGKATITAVFGGKSASTTFNVTDPAITSLQVTPAVWKVASGMPMQFQAVAIFSDNTTQNVTFQAQWSSSKTSIAQIGNKGPGPGGPPNKGRVQTKQPGVVTLTATFQGFKATGELTVTAAQPTGVSLFPGKHTCTKGEFRGFQASLLFSDGTSQNVTKGATWLSSDDKVASALNGMNQKGAVQCIAKGTVTISAAVGGYKGQASLEVKAATVTSLQIQPAVANVAVGVPLKFGVSAVMSDGTTQDVSWQTTFVSSDPTIASIYNGGGTAGWTQTLKAGQVTITGTWGGKSVKAKLTVKKAGIKSIELSPTQPIVVPGTYVKLNAVAILTDNTTQNIGPASSWTTSDAKVATVFNGAQGNPQANQNKGVVQALTPGKTTISATWNGKTGSTVVTVQKVSLKEIQITPFAPILPIGFVTRLRATAVFTDFSTQDLTGQVSWVSSAPGVAAVAAIGPTKGWVTPLGKGKATITATWEGKSGTTDVTVTDAKLQSVKITAPKTSIAVQETTQLVATGLFSGGLSLNITPYATWLSSDSSVIGVSNAFGTWGQAKGLKSGKTTITAVRSGIQGTIDLTVK